MKNTSIQSVKSLYSCTSCAAVLNTEDKLGQTKQDCPKRDCWSIQQCVKTERHCK